jgi:hypothetical protein
MPDVWTKRPEIVRDLLKEAGFRCGVEGRFLKGRDPAWTRAFDGKAMYGDLYIHHADQLRSERPLDGRLRHRGRRSTASASGPSQLLRSLWRSRARDCGRAVQSARD